mmetsp:Transcript_8180/g.20058  ORF Transcript_8180/g.20058 Transcript_8180/m.20058 type:complete len:245 (-) Transcript_8180:232-966(-)
MLVPFVLPIVRQCCFSELLPKLRCLLFGPVNHRVIEGGIHVLAGTIVSLTIVLLNIASILIPWFQLRLIPYLRTPRVPERMVEIPHKVTKVLEVSHEGAIPLWHPIEAFRTAPNGNMLDDQVSSFHLLPRGCEVISARCETDNIVANVDKSMFTPFLPRPVRENVAVFIVEAFCNCVDAVLEWPPHVDITAEFRRVDAALRGSQINTIGHNRAYEFGRPVLSTCQLQIADEMSAQLMVGYRLLS